MKVLTTSFLSVCFYVSAGVFRCQKRVAENLKLELQSAVTCRCGDWDPNSNAHWKSSKKFHMLSHLSNTRKVIFSIRTFHMEFFIIFVKIPSVNTCLERVTFLLMIKMRVSVNVPLLGCPCWLDDVRIPRRTWAAKLGLLG